MSAPGCPACSAGREAILMETDRQRLNGGLLFARGAPARALLCLALTALFLVPHPVLGQVSVWTTVYEVALKSYAEKNYASAEKLSLEAVQEAEGLPGEGKYLLKSLLILHKVYLAQDKLDKAKPVEERIISLGASLSDGESAAAGHEQGATASGAEQPSHASGEATTGGELKSAAEKSADKVAAVNTARTDWSATPRVTRAKQLLQMSGHSGWTKSIDIAPEGDQAISGSADSTIRLWDLTSGNEVGRLDGHDEAVNCVVFSPSGSQALSASSDKTVRLWDLETAREIKKFLGHANIVTCAAFSPAEGKIASGSYDGTVRIWDIQTGKELRQMEGNLGTVRCLAFTPDGEQLVSAGTDKTLSLWRLKDGKLVRRFSGHSKEISSVAVSSDGAKILSAGKDLSLRVWDLDSGDELKCLLGHDNWIVKAGFVSVDKAVSGSLDKTFRLWDIDEGRELHIFSILHYGMWSLGFSESGDRAITGSDDFTLRVWQLKP